MHYGKTILTLASAVFLLTSAVLGAIPAWDITFGGPRDDSASSVQQTKEGGYIIAGTTSSYCAGGTDAWLIKTDANGNRLWDKTFGGPGDDSASSVQQTKEGGYIIAGTTSSYGAGGTDVWLIQTDANGNLIWDRTFGGQGNDSASSVEQTSDSGYIIAGTTSSYGAGIYYKTNGTNDWLIKTDYKGIRQWDRTFGGQGNDSASSVQQTSDGGYIIAGTTSSYGAGGTDAWLIKTDANGNRLWDKTFGGPGGDSASSVQQTSDGGYIIAGTTSSYGAGIYYKTNGTNAWLIKTDANGTRLWDRTFGGSANDSASSVQQTSDGGYIIAGTTSSYGAGIYYKTNGTDAWLIKTDANGTRLWDRTFGGSANDSASLVKQTKEGGYIISGTTSSYGAGGSDVWLLYVLDEMVTPKMSEAAPRSIGFDVIIATVGLLTAMYVIVRLRK